MGTLCDLPYMRKNENKNSDTSKKKIPDPNKTEIALPKKKIETPGVQKTLVTNNSKKTGKNRKPLEKFNSTHAPSLEDISDIRRRLKSKLSKTVKIPTEFIKRKIKNNKSVKNFIESKKEAQKFLRRNKKCTSLKEKSRICQKMGMAEMNLAVSNELLVLQQRGKVTDRYRRGKKIETDSLGTVYEAKNIIFNNVVSMKIIHKKEENSESEDNRILNEINILKRLSHPNIVKIFEFFDSSVYYYIITEFCKNGELFSYIKILLSENQLSVIFYQILSGLWYLHDNKIIHRDLKLENILISEKENDLKTNEEYIWIKIIDFATSKIFAKNKKERALVGSYYYIAPEVLLHNYNEKCDLWSVGVCLYIALVGKPPFNGENNDEIIKKIKIGDYNMNEPKLLESSEEVKDLLSKLLEKNASKRISAKEALQHPWFKKFDGRKLFSNFNDEDIQPYIDNCLNYSFTSKIQSIVIAFLVHNLPNSESSKIILKIFRYFNKSGNCKLTKQELIDGLCKYRDVEEVEKKVNDIFIMLDSDNNGYIEFEEFLRACMDKKEILTEDNMKFAFKFLDRDNSETLSAPEIMEAFFTKPNPVVEEAFHQSLVEVDDDGDGIISYDRFRLLMLKSMEK